MRDIVLYGPPLAGKATLLAAFAEGVGLTVEPFPAGDGDDGVWDRGLRLTLAVGSTSAATISGGVWNKRGWASLLERASVVLLVLDPQEARFEADHECVANVLKLAHRPRTCVVFTKSDLTTSGLCEEALENVLTAPRALRWPRFHTSPESTVALCRPLVWELEQLRDSLA